MPIGINKVSRNSQIGTDIPDSGNLQTQYNATQSGSVTTSGGDVTDWQDVVGSNDVSGTATSYDSSGINGNAAIRFDGNDDQLDDTWSGTINQPFQIYAVLDADVEKNHAFFKHNSTVNCFEDRNGNNDPELFAGSGLRAPNDSSTTSPEIVLFSADGSSSKIRVNGSDVVTGDAGSNDLTDGVSFSVGAGFGASYFDGHIGEILVYDNNHSSSTITDVENYLSNKWGITI
jgi:hypothetical protein